MLALPQNQGLDMSLLLLVFMRILVQLQKDGKPILLSLTLFSTGASIHLLLAVQILFQSSVVLCHIALGVLIHMNMKTLHLASFIELQMHAALNMKSCLSKLQFKNTILHRQFVDLFLT